MRKTIEPKTSEYTGLVRWWLVEHATYPESSVLAGQPLRRMVRAYDTAAEAQAAAPDAELLDHSTGPWITTADSLADLSELPSCPPDWFDEEAAGEHWDDDY